VQSCRLIGLVKNPLADVWILVSASGEDNDSWKSNVLFDIDANTNLQMPGEATELASHMDAMSRMCDVDIFGTEDHAKPSVRDVLTWRPRSIIGSGVPSQAMIPVR